MFDIFVYFLHVMSLVACAFSCYMAQVFPLSVCQYHVCCKCFRIVYR